MSVLSVRHARTVMQSKQLGGRNLSPGEIDARDRGFGPDSTYTWRAGENWANKAGYGNFLTRTQHK